MEYDYYFDIPNEKLPLGICQICKEEHEMFDYKNQKICAFCLTKGEKDGKEKD